MTANGSDVTVNGITFGFWNGWLDAGDTNRNEIDKAITYSGFTLPLVTQAHRCTLNSAKNPSTCYAQHQEALSAGASPTISTVLKGC